MDLLLAKVLAIALAFSQVAVDPQSLKTEFDARQDTATVAALLQEGCSQVRKAFDIEDIRLDELIETAMDDPQAVESQHVLFRGLKLADLHKVYRQFCNGEAVEDSPVDLGEVIAFYNDTLKDISEDVIVQGLKRGSVITIVDQSGHTFAETYRDSRRGSWASLFYIPVHVQQAFVATEDKAFFEHKGIDPRGLIRAFIANLGQSGRPQGGSTLTQQVVKNLLTGNDVTYERKIREIALAARLEQMLSKQQILEIYLNSIYLGRGAWGIERAARSYFGKSVASLSLEEAALLAAITKGPNYFDPERHPERVKERYAYVLSRMAEDGVLAPERAKEEAATLPSLIPREAAKDTAGSYFADQVRRELSGLSLEGTPSGNLTVRSTLHPAIQRAAESALQEGLARYEIDAGRAEVAAEANLSDAVARHAASGANPTDAWKTALAEWKPSGDVRWQSAILLELSSRSGPTVGLRDGRVVPLRSPGREVRSLKVHDVVFVQLSEQQRRRGNIAELRTRPAVQGAAVVLENRTGRILGLVGGFSYATSQLNRITQSQRQPGSALKPLTYLAALQKGLQPNTLVRDEPITLAPANGSKRQQDYWSPKNYDGGSSGIVSLRAALENSRNLATANLLNGGIAPTPALSLGRVCALAVELQLYKECSPYFPFVLGAQALRPIDLAAFYATIANEGRRPTPHTIEAVDQNGVTAYRSSDVSSRITGADAGSFYQLKAMMQGVVRNGTARAIASLVPFVAGKTGTTDDENDAWFVGFTNDVTIAVWVGYDNADGNRRTLGSGQTGGSVAVPIFERIVASVWEHHSSRSALSDPSAEALAVLAVEKGRRQRDRSRELVEHYRADARGRPVDARFALIAKTEDSSSRRSRTAVPRRLLEDNAAATPFAWDPSERQWRRTPAEPAWVFPDPRRSSDGRSEWFLNRR
jgi:penicillin-binding protein 1A